MTLSVTPPGDTNVNNATVLIHAVGYLYSIQACRGRSETRKGRDAILFHILLFMSIFCTYAIGASGFT